jgi:hypothetical protein
MWFTMGSSWVGDLSVAQYTAHELILEFAPHSWRHVEIDRLDRLVIN